MALDFAAGCLGGCAGVLVGHPLDTVKVHLQTQDARRPMYRGTFDCIKKIVARDSIRGLYRGMSSPIAGVAFVNAIVFGVYGNVQRNTNDPNTIKSHFLAGSAAGLVQSLVCAPMELAKTRLQLQENVSGGTKYKGPMDCLVRIARKNGIKGVFRGLGITAVRDVPGLASYFVSYELMTRYASSSSGFVALIAGGLAGTFSWIISFPVDVIKSRIQADGMNGAQQFSSIRDCMKKGFQSEGWSLYTRGLVPTLLRAFPMNAVCFFVVSTVLKMSDKVHHIDVEIYKTEPVAVIGLMAAPVVCSVNTHTNNESHAAIQRHKNHTVKSLLVFGAFSEAVCKSEIMELANDLYDDHRT